MNRFANIIEEAEEKRLKRALTGLFNETYRMRNLKQKESEVKAYVSNGDGKDYGVAISESQVLCHCPDYFFTNEGICKHILMLSFALLANDQREWQVDN
jgi:hypothetical protein